MSAPAAHVAHAAPGRVRLRLSDPVDAATMAALVDRIAALGGGPTRVVGRPATGSLIVETPETAAALTARLAAAAVLRPVPAPTPPPLRQTVELGLLKADMAVAARTGGALDLRAAVAVLLLAAAAWQLAQGRVFGPATSLGELALGLLGGRRGR